MRRKITLLVICETLGLFVNTLTAGDKYYLCNSGNLPQAIQMELSKNKKLSLKFSLNFLKFASNFENSEKKDGPHSLCISKTKDSQRDG